MIQNNRRLVAGKASLQATNSTSGGILSGCLLDHKRYESQKSGGIMSGTFPVWVKKLIDRVNAGGDEGIPGILDHLPLFQRAGVHVCREGFLAEFGRLIVRYECTKPVCGSVGQPFSDKEYLVPVTYAPLPSFAELKKEFGKNNVSNLFDGREWKNHSSCIGIDETPSDKVFLVKHFGRETLSEDNIAEMDKLGYRPATHIEAYEFQKKHPELQRQLWIVALGSFAMVDDYRCVAVLGSNSGRRVLGYDWFGDRWSAGCRFLFVRK